ncbi:MAG: tRNA-dihydrouridine synthase [Thermoplasmata archaeon]|nr:tRNA-dihydrouridine synthase [Thermoplasmata archaeon]
MKLDGVSVSNRFVQAPMAGVTDAAFRTVARRFHTGLLFTEMISAEGLCRANWKTLKYTEILPDHRPVALQLVGRDPERIAAAAVLAEKLGIDIIDINAGCPQVRIAATGSGGALLRSPGKLADIVKQVKSAVSIPVSVKMRLGNSRDESPELTRLVQDAGADFITLHGRTVAQGFSGESDWEAIRNAAANLDIPVLANGDARNEELAVGLLKKTGAAGVMLGRATRGRPDLPGTADSLLNSGSFVRMSSETIVKTVTEHARLERELFGELAGMKRMRKHVTWYLKAAHLPYETHEVYRMENADNLESILEKALGAKD